MKVKELISLLQHEGPEQEVKFAYNYGDYWKTIVCQDIKNVNEELVCYSEYHRMDKLSDPEDDEDKDKMAVILS